MCEQLIFSITNFNTYAYNLFFLKNKGRKHIFKKIRKGLH